MPHSQLAWLAWLSRSSLLPVRSFVPDIPTVTATDSISHCKPLLHESPRCTAPWRPWNPWTRVAKTPAVRRGGPRDCRNTFPHDPNFKHQTSCVVKCCKHHWHPWTTDLWHLSIVSLCFVWSWFSVLYFCFRRGCHRCFGWRWFLHLLGLGLPAPKPKKKTSETGSFDGSWVVSFGLSTSTALSKWSQVESHTEMVMHAVTAGVYLWNHDSSLHSHLKLQNETKRRDSKNRTHDNRRIKSDRSLSICPSFVLACFNCLVCPSGFFMCFLTSGIAGCALDFAPCHLGTDEHSMKHSRSCRASHKGYWKCQPMEIRRVQMSQWSST